jgi:hypothetical protein
MAHRIKELRNKQGKRNIANIHKDFLHWKTSVYMLVILLVFIVKDLYVTMKGGVRFFL